MASLIIKDKAFAAFDALFGSLYIDLFFLYLQKQKRSKRCSFNFLLFQPTVRTQASKELKNLTIYMNINHVKLNQDIS